MEKKILIGVSARHVHLSLKDLENLFGKNYNLTKDRKLNCPGEFAAKETIDIKSGERILKNVRIIGPIREKTQAELSHTDIVYLKIKPVVRLSGDIKNTPGAIFIGPKGKIKIKEGIINNWRHIHCNLKKAKELNLKEGMLVSVKTKGDCSLIFNNVKVRISKECPFSLHLDTDEGNAAGIIKNGTGYLLL